MQDYNQAVIKTIQSKPVSPMKKVKRRVGYQKEATDAEVNDSEQQLKKLRLGGAGEKESTSQIDREDTPMN